MEQHHLGYDTAFTQQFYKLNWGQVDSKDQKKRLQYVCLFNHLSTSTESTVKSSVVVKKNSISQLILNKTTLILFLYGLCI